MMQTCTITVRVMMAIIQRDFTLFKENYVSKIGNFLATRLPVILVFQYIMPHVGLKEYGAFMAVTEIANWGFFSLIGFISKFVGDLQGDQTIAYYLTLPLRQ